MKKIEVTGYISKAGKNGTYKITARFTTPDSVKRVKLENFGEKPVAFWVDADKLCTPPPPIRRVNEETRQCWECGCSFTYREAKANDGDWSESYCGC